MMMNLGIWKWFVRLMYQALCSVPRMTLSLMMRQFFPLLISPLWALCDTHMDQLRKR